MAVRADFQVQFLLGRPRLPGRPARTPGLDLVIIRMNAFLHGGNSFEETLIIAGFLGSGPLGAPGFGLGSGLVALGESPGSYTGETADAAEKGSWHDEQNRQCEYLAEAATCVNDRHSLCVVPDDEQRRRAREADGCSNRRRSESCYSTRERRTRAPRRHETRGHHQADRDSGGHHRPLMKVPRRHESIDSHSYDECGAE